MRPQLKANRLHGCFLVLGALWATACGPPQEANSGEDALHLEWELDRTEANRAFVTRALEDAVSSTEGLERGSSGSVLEFAPGPEAHRVLLETYIGEEAVLLVLQEGTPTVSDPLVIGRWILGGFGPVEVADYDGDLLPDAAYCLWPENESADGEPRVSGFKDGAWYTIEHPSGELPKCSAG